LIVISLLKVLNFSVSLFQSNNGGFHLEQCSSSSDRGGANVGRGQATTHCHQLYISRALYMLCDNLGGLANFQEALTSESMTVGGLFGVAGAEFQS